MDLSLNDVQLAVLRWIDDGCDLASPPTANFKTSAVALRSRGLIELDRRRGRWNATIAEKGRYYLEHGRHPDTGPRVRPPSRGGTSAPQRTQVAPTVRHDTEQVLASSAPTPTAPPSADQNTAPTARPAKDETIPMPTQLRKPHPAMRELIDYKSRLDLPAGQRQRALLILHALVQESLRRGWGITPVKSSMHTDWVGKRVRSWPNQDLLKIDAGSYPAAIRVRMKLRRVAHAATKEEIAESERWGHPWYRSNDFVPTDKMRLEIGTGSSHPLVVEDTAATKIEQKLGRAIARIEVLSAEALQHQETARLREIEWAAQRRQAEEMASRARGYSRWIEVLERLRSDVAHHQELTTVLSGLRAAAVATGDERRARSLRAYIDWAEQHLRDADPYRTITLPEGEPPEMTYDEWQRWSASHPQVAGYPRY